VLKKEQSKMSKTLKQRKNVENAENYQIRARKKASKQGIIL
jgi:hypothetical protein